MIEDEDFYELQVWNDQYGGWVEVTSASSEDQLHDWIKNHKNSEMYVEGTIFSIVHFKRTVVK